MSLLSKVPHSIKFVLFLTILFSAMMASVVVYARVDADPLKPTFSAQTSQVFLPAALYGRVTHWSENSIFGVQTYNDTRQTSRFHKSMIDSGATWLRAAIYWSQAEPVNTSPANFKWVYADQVLAAGLPGNGGLKVIATIETAPSWAVIDPSRPDSPIKTENLADFAEFVAAIVERFDGDGFQDAPGSPVIDYWELYNEPDRALNTRDGRWGNHGAEYANMLSVIYPVIKSQNPRAKVVFGGLAFDFFDSQGGPFVRSFVDDVLAAGGGNYFDIFNFHSYPAFAQTWVPNGNPAGGPGLLQKAQYLEKLLFDAGFSKPTFITEAGWHSNNPPNSPGSEEIQARYVVQLFTQSLAAGVDSMIWWMLFDPSDGSWDNGLITFDDPPRRKLAFTAYQTIVNRLTYEEFVRSLGVSETGNQAVELYQFRDTSTGATQYIVWLNPIATTATTSIHLTAEEVSRYNLYGIHEGNLTDESDGTDDGRITISVNSQPAYIEVIR